MRKQAGISMSEVLAVMVVVGLGVGSAALYLKPAEAPVQSGAAMLEGLFRLARSRAMATTSAYRVVPQGTGRVVTEWAKSCSSSTWTLDEDIAVDLPEGVDMTDSSWSVCFSSRGMSDNNLSITLDHGSLRSRQVEVLLGGSVRIVP